MKSTIYKTIMAVAAFGVTTGISTSANYALAEPISIQTIVLSGDVAPGTGGATFVNSFQPTPSLNDAGQLGFRAFLKGPGVTQSNEEVVYKGDAGGLSLVARGGDPAPGGGTFTAFSAVSINLSNNTLFDGRTGPGTLDRGIYKETASGLALVARGGDTAPGTSGATYSEVFAPLRINNSNHTAFTARLTGSGVIASNDRAVFKETASGLVLVARAGDIAPGTGGATFGTSMDNGFVDESGTAAFIANFDGQSGIFREGANAPLVQTGDILPSTGATLGGVSTISYSDSGRVNFSAVLSGAGINPTNNTGVFSEGAGGFRLIARKGGVAPGTGGAIFNAFLPAAINDSGITVFLGTLTGPGVSSINNSGIFAADLLGNLKLIVRRGDTLEVRPDDFRIISGFDFQGQFGASNNVGEFAFILGFTDNSQGIFVATIPQFPSPVSIDIKPQSCPNPLDIKSKGVLPVAILGTADFDMSQIDVTTVQLQGVPPLRNALEDVATPFVPVNDNTSEFDCTDQGPDGFADLTLKFDTQQVVAALGDVKDSEVLILTLNGQLFDGTPIQGKDVIVILSKNQK